MKETTKETKETTRETKKTMRETKETTREMRETILENSGDEGDGEGRGTSRFDGEGREQAASMYIST